MHLRYLKKTGSIMAAAAALSGLPASSMAAVVSAGNPLDFNWSFDTGTSILDGTGTMTISGFNSDLLSVVVTLTNNADLGGLGGERLTSFGFGIDPNATSISFSDGMDGGMIGAQSAFGTLPANVAGIEVCGFGGSNCAGGGGGGIFGAGGSDTFTIRLGGTWGSSVNIDPIGFKYQTGYGSFEFPSSPPGRVPEPASAFLVGLGLLGVGFARRRKTGA